MAKQVETIWSYLTSQGYSVTPRPEKKVVHLVLESEKLNNSQKKRMDYTGYGSEKLDGVFAGITAIPKGVVHDRTLYEVRHWNRTGKAISNCEELDKEVEQLLYDNSDGSISKSFFFISEITSEDPLAKLSGYLNPNRVKGSTFTPTNMEDNFHDVMYLDEFIKGQCDIPFYVRRDLLEGGIIDGANIIPATFMSLEEAHEYAQEVWARKGEGVVFAQAQGTWTAGKRDETKIKLKEKLSYDVTVIGMCSGKKDSKYEHTLGKLLVAFRAFGEPDGERLVIPISGMTDAQRDEWWEHPERIVSACVKMDAKSFTENGNLREPRYKETRHDKGSDFPVKLSSVVDVFVKAQCENRVNLWEAA